MFLILKHSLDLISILLIPQKTISCFSTSEKSTTQLDVEKYTPIWHSECNKMQSSILDSEK